MQHNDKCFAKHLSLCCSIEIFQISKSLCGFELRLANCNKKCKAESCSSNFLLWRCQWQRCNFLSKLYLLKKVYYSSLGQQSNNRNTFDRPRFEC